MSVALEAAFFQSLDRLLGEHLAPSIALAVSGGGDSMAMLHLVHRWSQIADGSQKPTLKVVTVDHGLRPGSPQEAALVSREAHRLGLPHDTLRWQWDGSGNLQDAAREARLSLIEQWRGDTSHVLLAHTLDDVAETFLMRLKRGSGVDGLRAMAATRIHHPKHPHDPEARDDNPLIIVRPCLGIERAALRQYASDHAIPYVDDPSNENEKFERIKIRKAMESLELDPKRLAATASRMGHVAEALDNRARARWDDCAWEAVINGAPTGEVIFRRDQFSSIERETQARLFAFALCYISGQVYRPRYRALEALLEGALNGKGGTLHGCEVHASPEELVIFREFSTLKGTSVDARADGRWDNRWRIAQDTLPEGADLVLRALGEDGWAHIEHTHAPGVPFHRARSLPSLWDSDRLVACPALAHGPPVMIELRVHDDAAWMLRPARRPA